MKFPISLFTITIGIALGILITKVYERIILASSADNVEAVDVLKSRVLHNGDIAGYRKLEILALDEDPSNFLFWAMIMANKYNYSNAYWDVYFSIEQTFYGKFGDSALLKMDPVTREFAFKYLKEAANKGDSAALNELSGLKSRGIPFK